MRMLSLVGVVALSAAFTFGDGVLIRRDLKPNTETAYTVESNTTQTTVAPQGPMDSTMKLTMDYTEQLGDVDPDGKAAVTYVMSNIKSEATGPAAMMANGLPEKITASGKLDNRNQVSDSKWGEGISDAVKTQLGDSVVQPITFPEGEIKVGDTWEIPFPTAGMMKAKDQKLKATYTGDKTVDGVDCVVVNVDQEVPVDGDISDMLKNAPGVTSATIKGTVHVKVEALVEKAGGLVHSIDNTSEFKLTIELPDVGMSIENDGTTVTTVRLKK